MSKHPIDRASGNFSPVRESPAHLCLDLRVPVEDELCLLSIRPVPQHGHLGVGVDAIVEEVLAQVNALIMVELSPMWFFTC